MGNPSPSGYSISWPHLNGDEKNVAPCRACLLQLNGDENNEKMNFQFIDLPPQVKNYINIAISVSYAFRGRVLK